MAQQPDLNNIGAVSDPNAAINASDDEDFKLDESLDKKDKDPLNQSLGLNEGVSGNEATRAAGGTFNAGASANTNVENPNLQAPGRATEVQGS